MPEQLKAKFEQPHTSYHGSALPHDRSFPIQWESEACGVHREDDHEGGDSHIGCQDEETLIEQQSEHQRPRGGGRGMGIGGVGDGLDGEDTAGLYLPPGEVFVTAVLVSLKVYKVSSCNASIITF